MINIADKAFNTIVQGIPEQDLQFLNDTTDRALYIRIKVQHPLWSDDLVKKEIEALRSTEFAEWHKELFDKVQDKLSKRKDER